MGPRRRLSSGEACALSLCSSAGHYPQSSKRSSFPKYYDQPIPPSSTLPSPPLSPVLPPHCPGGTLLTAPTAARSGFAASAVLGPNPSANTGRDDPFGPGAAVGFGLGRSSSHDSGKSMPSAGWPSSGGGSAGGSSGGGGGGHTKSVSAPAVASAAAAAAGSMVSNGTGTGGGGRAGAGGRSNSVGSGGGGGGGGVGMMMNGGNGPPCQSVPDRPMSLFEGLAGSAVFLADCCVSEAGAGEHAWFPSLELSP